MSKKIEQPVRKQVVLLLIYFFPEQFATYADILMLCLTKINGERFSGMPVALLAAAVISLIMIFLSSSILGP